MLVKYKKSFEKIAMGLLSYMPNEKDLKLIQQTIKLYEEQEDLHLYFWKHEADLIGIIGLKEINDKIIIQHLALNPSYRNQGIGREMVFAIKDLYLNKNIVPTETTCNYIKNIIK